MLPNIKEIVMNFEQYKTHFTERALKSGFSYEFIQHCLDYSEILLRNNAPIIYDLNHFAGLVGYNTTYLKRAALSTFFFYRHFPIDKKNSNKKRIISEPLPSLKSIQHFILTEILYKQNVSKFCKSYIPKKKLNDYIKFHINPKELLTLDIENFFSSIKFPFILKYFKGLGYSEEVSVILAKLCTISEKIDLENDKARFLPQGSATSPYLSNLILKTFDERLAVFCLGNNWRYTRYADDMAFSGDHLNQEKIIAFVKNELFFLNLKLNMEKVNFMDKSSKQLIAGVIVNEKMQLPKNQRRELRNIIYHIKTKTLKGHLQHIDESPENYLSHLLGRVQYGLNLNPKDKHLISYKNFLIEEKKALER